MPTMHADARNDELFKASFSSASSLMALQLVSRLFTFGLNQALFRMASPLAFGTAAIQFELMLSTILFLSREGVRSALLRVPQRELDKSKLDQGTASATCQITDSNETLLPLIFGFPLAIIISYLYGRSAGFDTRSQPHFHMAISIYALAAMVELLSEPMHISAMGELRTAIRVKAEGLGIISKTTVTFVALLYDSRDGQGEYALMAFAVGQLAYGISVFGAYVAYYGLAPLWLKPSSNPRNRYTPAAYFDPVLLRLSLTMSSQSLVKHVLTEGDKLMLSWLSPLQDQGGYAIAVNYGSLVARIVFQPIEEILRVLFSKMLSVSPSTSEERSPTSGQTQVAGALILLLSIQVSLSMILLVFGTSYIPIILHIILPAQYLSTSAPKVLTAWVWYIPVLAINGGLEAFLSSVATPDDLNKQSRWMTAFSMVYISAALALYSFHLGDSSLVYANIINLSARIVYSLYFISSWFGSRGGAGLLRWKEIVPTWQVVIASGSSTAMIWYSARTFRVMQIIDNGERAAISHPPVTTHIALGTVLALMCLGTWWISFGRFLIVPMHIKSE